MCDYCDGDYFLYKREKGKGTVSVFVYDDFHGEGIVVLYNEKNFPFKDLDAKSWSLVIPITYCPKCGRKLGENKGETTS